MSKRTYGHVFVLPSRRLVRPAAEDDFSKNVNTCLFSIATAWFRPSTKYLENIFCLTVLLTLSLEKLFPICLSKDAATLLLFIKLLKAYKCQLISEACSEPFQASKTELFMKTFHANVVVLVSLLLTLKLVSFWCLYC